MAAAGAPSDRNETARPPPPPTVPALPPALPSSPVQVLGHKPSTKQQPQTTPGESRIHPATCDFRKMPKAHPIQHPVRCETVHPPGPGRTLPEIQGRTGPYTCNRGNPESQSRPSSWTHETTWNKYRCPLPGSLSYRCPLPGTSHPEGCMTAHGPGPGSSTPRPTTVRQGCRPPNPPEALVPGATPGTQMQNFNPGATPRELVPGATELLKPSSGMGSCRSTDLSAQQGPISGRSFLVRRDGVLPQH